MRPLAIDRAIERAAAADPASHAPAAAVAIDCIDRIDPRAAALDFADAAIHRAIDVAAAARIGLAIAVVAAVAVAAVAAAIAVTAIIVAAIVIVAVVAVGIAGLALALALAGSRGNRRDHADADDSADDPGTGIVMAITVAPAAAAAPAMIGQSRRCSHCQRCCRSKHGGGARTQNFHGSRPLVTGEPCPARTRTGIIAKLIYGLGGPGFRQPEPPAVVHPPPTYRPRMPSMSR